jgi:hypothetical protein
VPGKDLDARLHDRFPLYHGSVPSEGTLLDGMRGAFEDILAAQGVKAAVTATLYTDPKLQKVTAMSFAVSAPPVQVGEMRPDSDSAALGPKAQEILAKLTGSAYDAVGSPSQIMANLGNFYRDKATWRSKSALHSRPFRLSRLRPFEFHFWSTFHRARCTKSQKSNSCPACSSHRRSLTTSLTSIAAT